MIAPDNVLSDLGYDVIQNWLKDNCQSYGGKKLSSTFFNYNNLELKNELDLTEELINSIVRKDPTITIFAAEVLDESLLLFFESLKKKSQNSPGNQATLKVTANTRALVIIDGSISAETKEIINLNPGFHEIEIKASGYKTIRKPPNVRLRGTNFELTSTASDSV